MINMKKIASRVLLITMLVCGSILINTVDFVFGQAPGVIIIISSDTTWTKADSPHNITGPLLVNEGVTLTIEAGTSLKVNNYGIRVDGTLRAIGSSAQKIQFDNCTEIEFTTNSNGWNEQTSSGSIIEYAILGSCVVSSNVSLKLDNTVFGSITSEDSVISSNNEISDSVRAGSSCVITNNSIGDKVWVGNLSLISNNTIGGNVIAQDAIISNNNITGKVIADESTISNNEIRDGISGNSLVITNNVVTVVETPPGEYYGGDAGITIEGGSSVISGNTFNGGGYHYDPWWRGLSRPIGALDIRSSSAVISANVIEGNGIRLSNDCDVLVIANNSINSGIFCSYTDRDGYSITYKASSFEISGNIITGGIEINADILSVSNNKIVGTGKTGIQFSVSDEEITSITNNMISNCSTGISGSNTKGILIENNLILNNTNGIAYTGESVIIQNNTITNNTVGIYGYSSSAIIRYNNIENNSDKSIYLEGVSNDLDVPHNWWGTTDIQAINLTIHDYKYDFDLGKVNFVPFLTEPNPEAMPNEFTVIPELPSWTILPLLLTATVLVIFCRRKLKTITK